MPKARTMTIAEAYRRYCLITGWIARSFPDGLAPLDIFAELISGGPDEEWAMTPSDAAREMGLKPIAGNVMLQRMRQSIGERAI